jgi:hypothetical protein
MNGYIKGENPLGYNASDIPFGEICGGYVIPIKKRKPEILILEIKLTAEVARELVHKAKDASIAAGAGTHVLQCDT